MCCCLALVLPSEVSSIFEALLSFTGDSNSSAIKACIYSCGQKHSRYFASPLFRHSRVQQPQWSTTAV